MKKQLVILFLLAASQLSAETVTRKQGDGIDKRIDNKIRIYHTPGKHILAQYLETKETHKDLDISVGSANGSITKIIVHQLDCDIDYSQPGKFRFMGVCNFLLYPSINTNTIDAIPAVFILQIENLTTPEAFEKQAQDWIKAEVNKPTFTMPEEFLNKIPGYKELLTHTLQMGVREWKKFIVLFKVEIDEQLNQEHEKATMEKLQKLKNLLANFK